MASLTDLEQAGKLVLFRPKLDPDQMMERQVYLAPEAHDWCFSSTELERASPNDRAFDLVHAQLRSFVVGCLMLEGAEMRRLKPPKTAAIKEVWECKTTPPDAVRMFGWFYRRGIFIVSHMRFKRDLRTWKSYIPEMNRVVSFRASLNLNAPTYAEGKTLDDYL